MKALHETGLYVYELAMFDLYGPVSPAFRQRSSANFRTVLSESGESQIMYDSSLFGDISFMRLFAGVP